MRPEVGSYEKQAIVYISIDLHPECICKAARTRRPNTCYTHKGIPTMWRSGLAILALITLASCHVSESEIGIEQYEIALRYIQSSDLWDAFRATYTSCSPVPPTRPDSTESRIAVYPRVVKYLDETTLLSGRARIEMCQQGVDSYTALMNPDSVPSELKIDSSTVLESCVDPDKLSAEWKRSWHARFASNDTTIDQAEWALYFSPPCGNELVATIDPHWENGKSGDSFEFYFRFNAEGEIEWVSVGTWHSHVPPSPLRGWKGDP